MCGNTLHNCETYLFWDLNAEEGFCSYEQTTEEDGNYTWIETMGNTQQTQLCLNTQGNATRNCLTGGLWTPVDFLECVMRELILDVGML